MFNLSTSLFHCLWSCLLCIVVSVCCLHILNYDLTGQDAEFETVVMFGYTCPGAVIQL